MKLVFRYNAFRFAAILMCVVRRHKFWERDTLLTAIAFGRSRRCRWCNRLILKKDYRKGVLR